MSVYTVPPAAAAAGPLDRFWHPPPNTIQQLPGIRRELRRFPSPALRVSRVAQLDANLLDNELEAILGGPVWKALAALGGPGRRNYEPEMMALLRIAVLKMSLYDKGATYGSNLQNLKYRNEWNHQAGARQSTAVDSSLLPVQKAAYMTLQVLPAYLHARIRDRMLSSSWSDEPLPRTWLSLVNPARLTKKRRLEEDGLLQAEWKRVAWELTNIGERLGVIAGLVNFLVFLHDGRYRTLVDRLLGMRLIYAQRSITPNVSFEFLNRQLVWEAFTEFLLFIMPLINIRKIRTRLLRFVSTRANKYKSLNLLLSALPTSVAQALGVTARQRLISSAGRSNSSGTGSAQLDGKPLERLQGPLYFLPPSTCPICYAASNAPPTSLPTDPTSRDPDEQHRSSRPSSAGGLADTIASSSSGIGGGGSGADTVVKIPYVTDCGWRCRYCYYCIVSKLSAVEDEGDESWSCLRCGLEVHGVEREQSEGADMQEKGNGDGTGDGSQSGGEPVEAQNEDNDEGDDDDREVDREDEDDEGLEGEAERAVEEGSDDDLDFVGEDEVDETASISSEHNRWR